MDENNNLKMSTGDKIVSATAIAVMVGTGAACGFYLRKSHLLAIKAVAEQNKMLDIALGQTISLVAESLKK